MKCSCNRFLIVIAILFTLIVLGTTAAVLVTEQPWFCNSCHLMKPYYHAWTESVHKNVNCLECHYEPNIKSHIIGKINGLMQVLEYITGRYSEKPSAHVRDVSCLREGCHDKEKLKVKKIMFKDKVKFSHETHWKEHPELGQGIKLRCATCHMWLTFDKHVAVDENTCLICHFKNVPISKIVTQCLGCHTEIHNNPEHKEYIAAETACTECHTTIKTSDAPVLRQMCYFCHADQTKVDKIKDRELMHQKHIPQNNADCMNCHELIAHGKE